MLLRSTFVEGACTHHGHALYMYTHAYSLTQNTFARVSVQHIYYSFLVLQQRAATGSLASDSETPPARSRLYMYIHQHTVNLLCACVYVLDAVQLCVCVLYCTVRCVSATYAL